MTGAEHLRTSNTTDVHAYAPDASLWHDSSTMRGALRTCIVL